VTNCPVTDRPVTDSPMITSANAVGTTLSLPEELQLALPLMTGQLRFGSMDIAVAAIIDLALRGRIVATKSRFAQPSSARLTLVDAAPIGNAPLDAVMRAFVARGKPWKAYSAVTELWATASEATTASLVARGAVSAHGFLRDRGGRLEPLDQELRHATMVRLDRAPSASDPLATVLLDIRQHSAWGWTAKPGQRKPPLLGDYSENVAITARGALSALYIATGSAV